MDYIREAKEYLKNYNNLKVSLSNFEDKIKELKESKDNLKSLVITDMPSGSGSEAGDDKIANILYNLEKARINKRLTETSIKNIERSLERFRISNDSEYEKVLRYWYIDQLVIEEIQKKMNCSERNVYYLQNKAIRIFAVSLFGIKGQGI